MAAIPSLTNTSRVTPSQTSAPSSLALEAGKLSDHKIGLIVIAAITGFVILLYAGLHWRKLFNYCR